MPSILDVSFGICRDRFRKPDEVCDVHKANGLCELPGLCIEPAMKEPYIKPFEIKDTFKIQLVIYGRKAKVIGLSLLNTQCDN